MEEEEEHGLKAVLDHRLNSRPAWATCDSDTERRAKSHVEKGNMFSFLFFLMQNLMKTSEYKVGGKEQKQVHGWRCKKINSWNGFRNAW